MTKYYTATHAHAQRDQHLGWLVSLYPRCFIPRFGGVILSQAWKEALWDKCDMGAPRLCTPSELQYRHPLPTDGSILRMRLSGGRQSVAEQCPVDKHDFQLFLAINAIAA